MRQVDAAVDLDWSQRNEIRRIIGEELERLDELRIRRQSGEVARLEAALDLADIESDFAVRIEARLREGQREAYERFHSGFFDGLWAESRR